MMDELAKSQDGLVLVVVAIFVFAFGFGTGYAFGRAWGMY